MRSSPRMISETFRVPEVPELPLRFNVAPTQPVGVVRQDEHERHFDYLRWGLVPSWADDPKIGSRLINARADTVATKPAFRAAFKERRCLVVADGFFEWHTVNGRKQPFLIHRADGRPFGFAGLWERWRRGDSPPMESCTIITTDANDLMRPIHDRMPVILQPADFDRWLDPEPPSPETLQSLLKPYAEGDLVATPVGTQVNNARNDSPECVAPFDPTKPEPGMLF